MKPFLPPNEDQRIAKLLSYQVLDTVAETAYDDLTHLAAFICGTPISLVSLVDHDRQWFKSAVGLSASETSRDVAFCAHAILSPDEPLLVPDALGDDRFATNPLVTGAPHIRFYAGAPLVSPEGHALGTLCVIDYEPRQLSPEQTRALMALARQVVSQLELRLSLGTLAREVSERQQVQTALKQAWEATKEQSRLLRTVIDSTPDWIFAKDRNFRYILVNQGYASAIGKTADEMLGQDDLELGFSPDLVWGSPSQGIRGFRVDDQEVLRGATLHNHHDPATQADGSLRIYDTRKTPLRNENGQIIAVLGLARDVTEREQSQAALEQANAQLETRVAERTLDFQRLIEQLEHEIVERQQTETDRQKLVSLVESSSDFIGLATLEGQVLYVNEAGQNMVGLDGVAAVRRSTLTDYFTPDHLTYFSETILPITLTQGRWIGEVSFRHFQTQQAIPVHYNFFCIKDLETNEPIALAAVGQDIMEQKQAEELLRHSEAQLRQQTQDLEQALRTLKRTQAKLVQSEKMSSLGQLVAGVAHEINNPVSFIYGNLTYADEYIRQLLELLHLYQQYYPAPVAPIQAKAQAIELEFLLTDLPKLLASMRVGAERIQTIVQSLRNFSRMDEAELKAVDLHEGLDSTLMILQHRLRNQPRRPAIQVVKDYGCLPLVMCCPGQLNQVFMNILANAIDALEDLYQPDEENFPAQIFIRTEADSTSVRIKIQDNGPGISASLQAQLFDPFFTTKPIGKGTGLGLSISYQIIAEKHHGSLTCNSLPGQGAEFVVDLPLHQPFYCPLGQGGTALLAH